VHIICEYVLFTCRRSYAILAQGLDLSLTQCSEDGTYGRYILFECSLDISGELRFKFCSVDVEKSMYP